MSSIIKFFRITFFLVLYFFLCMVVVTTMLQAWPIGGQMLFAFGVPVILVWWQEKRRSRKVAAKAQAEGSSANLPSRPEPVPRPSAYDKRIERERERTREANASKQPAAVQAYSPPKCKCWIKIPQKCWRKIPHLTGSGISRAGDWHLRFWVAVRASSGAEAG